MCDGTFHIHIAVRADRTWLYRGTQLSGKLPLNKGYVTLGVNLHTLCNLKGHLGCRRSCVSDGVCSGMG